MIFYFINHSLIVFYTFICRGALRYNFPFMGWFWNIENTFFLFRHASMRWTLKTNLLLRFYSLFFISKITPSTWQQYECYSRIEIFFFCLQKCFKMVLQFCISFFVQNEKSVFHVYMLNLIKKCSTSCIPDVFLSLIS